MCGIVGIIGPSQQESSVWAAYESYRGLLTLQHRGQDAAGILSYDFSSEKFYQEKDLGLISEVFNQKKISNLKGSMAIAHNRYATTGTDGKLDLQPIVTGTPLGVGMVHNGNLVNYHSLKEQIKSQFKYQLLTNNDLEIILNYWCHFLEGKPFSFSQALVATEKLFKTINGGYSVIGMVAGEGMMAFRDPQGIRPLVMGRRKETAGYTYCFASETAVFNFLGFDYVRDIKPGEFVFVPMEGELKSALIPSENNRVAHCMFEWVYFSSAESAVENQSVYKVRLNLGTALAKKAALLIEQGHFKPDVVMPVPDTSRTSAISVAKELGIDYREGLIKNRYIHRSFILNSQEKREKAIELKLSPIRSEIEGKSIFLIDDSIVRGTTSKKIIRLLKRYGAREVILGVTCPPLRFGCYYGIDFPTSKELVASQRRISEIAQIIEAKEIIYIDEEDLKKAIGQEGLCLACIDGKYPTSVEEGAMFALKRQLEKNL